MLHSDQGWLFDKNIFCKFLNLFLLVTWLCMLTWAWCTQTVYTPTPTVSNFSNSSTEYPTVSGVIMPTPNVSSVINSTTVSAVSTPTPTVSNVINSTTAYPTVSANSTPTPTVSNLIHSNRQSPIFYGVITHHSKVALQKCVHNTWGTRAQLHWYSDKPSDLINANVIVNPAGESYENMFWKCMVFWRKVLQDHGSGNYSWYLRLWEDNYVLVENVENFLKHEVYEIFRPNSPDLDEQFYASPLFRFLNWKGKTPNFSEPVVLGNLSPYVQSRGEKFPFLGGGGGWAMNLPAMQLLIDNEAFCYDFISNNNDIVCKNWCEDVMIGECLRALKVQFVEFCGVFGLTPGNQYSCAIKDEDLSNHSKVRTRYCDLPNLSFNLGYCPRHYSNPLTFHYMNPAEQQRVEKLWYKRDADCS